MYQSPQTGPTNQTPFENGEHMSSFENDLKRLTSEAYEAYTQTPDKPRFEDSSTLGAAASRYDQHTPSAAELADSYELQPLTLEQLGMNIEAVRRDALNKTINPSPVVEFAARKKSDFDLAA